MSEAEIIGTQVIEIQELQKKNDVLISVVLALKNGDLDIDQIELQGTGFTVSDEQDEINT